MKSNIGNSLFNLLKYRFNLDDDGASEDEVVEGIKRGVEFKGINLWTLIFAIFIASIGLNINSTAVIIGAMLISPLMGPIMGIGLGAGTFDFELIKKALKNLLMASLIGLLTSVIYFLISPLNVAQSELLARTTPTIWDVLIAFFGGLAGIVASSRKKYNNVIPGVAIATALMPPLCTAGYGIATAQWSYFLGAFYLYLINSVYISIATFLIVRFLKFKAHTSVNNETNIKVKEWVGIIAFLTILPSIYLAYHFVKNEIFKQHAEQLINEEIVMNGITVLNKKIDPEKNEITIAILDFDKIDSIKQVLEMDKAKYKLSESRIIIKNNNASAKSDIPIAELKQGIIEDLFKKQEATINQKEDEIKNLKLLNNEQLQFEQKKKEAVDEFYSLYGEPKELIIDKAILHNKNNIDTVLFVYIKHHSATFNHLQLNSMQNWLKTKFKMNNIKVITD